MEQHRLSLRKTLEYLDCSKSHLHMLVKTGRLIPKYLGRKPYFSVSQIEAALTEKSEKLN